MIREPFVGLARRQHVAHRRLMTSAMLAEVPLAGLSFRLRLAIGGPRSIAGHVSSGGVPHETSSRHPPCLSGRCVASGIRDPVDVHRRPRRGSAGRERWCRHPSSGATKPASDGYIACPAGCDHDSSAGEHDGFYTGVSIAFLSGFRFGRAAVPAIEVALDKPALGFAFHEMPLREVIAKIRDAHTASRSNSTRRRSRMRVLTSTRRSRTTPPAFRCALGPAVAAR